MNLRTNKVRWHFIALLLILSFVLAACANVRRGVSWPALSTSMIGDQLGIIVSYDNQVVALDPQNGNVLDLLDSDGKVRRDAENNPLTWTINGKDYDNATFFANPFPSSAENGATLIFPTYTNRLMEFYTDSLQPVNTAGYPLTDGVVADVLVTDKLIYVPYQLQDIVAIDSKTYEEVWRFDTLEGVWATPLLHDGVLYVPSVDHKLYALNADTGTEIWHLDLEGVVASTPLFYNDSLYVGSYSHTLYKISLDGKILAQHEGSNWIWDTPVLFNDILYYADLYGYVYALNPDDLSEVWSTQVGNRGIRPSPIVTNDYVVLASRSGKLYWLNREDGSQIFERDMRGNPEILSDMLYIPADDTLGIKSDLIVVASADTKNLVAAYRLDNSVEQWVYSR